MARSPHRALGQRDRHPFDGPTPGGVARRDAGGSPDHCAVHPGQRCPRRVGGAHFCAPPPQNRACGSSSHTAQAGPEGRSVLLLSRHEDPAPQLPYRLLTHPSVDAIPSTGVQVTKRAFRSVHHMASNLSFGKGVSVASSS